MEGPIPAIAFVHLACGTWRQFFENHFPVVHSSVSRFRKLIKKLHSDCPRECEPIFLDKIFCKYLDSPWLTLSLIAIGIDIHLGASLQIFT